jgi:hypothetical protein
MVEIPMKWTGDARQENDNSGNPLHWLIRDDGQSLNIQAEYGEIISISVNDRHYRSNNSEDKNITERYAVVSSAVPSDVMGKYSWPIGTPEHTAQIDNITFNRPPSTIDGYWNRYITVKQVDIVDLGKVETKVVPPVNTDDKTVPPSVTQTGVTGNEKVTDITDDVKKENELKEPNPVMDWFKENWWIIAIIIAILIMIIAIFYLFKIGWLKWPSKIIPESKPDATA